jgi:hypothetical protein
LGTFCKFQSPFIYGRLNLSMKNIAIVSSLRIQIMPFAISILFEVFRRQYNMITWQFDLFFLQQVIKNHITLSDVKGVAHFILPIFRSRFQARAYVWFRFRPPIPFGYTHVGLFIIRRSATILYHVDMTLIPQLITTPRKAPRLFDLAFTIQSPL